MSIWFHYRHRKESTFTYCYIVFHPLTRENYHPRMLNSESAINIARKPGRPKQQEIILYGSPPWLLISNCFWMRFQNGGLFYILLLWNLRWELQRKIIFFPLPNRDKRWVDLITCCITLSGRRLIFHLSRFILSPGILILFIVLFIARRSYLLKFLDRYNCSLVLFLLETQCGCRLVIDVEKQGRNISFQWRRRTWQPFDLYWLTTFVHDEIALLKTVICRSFLRPY